MKDMMIEKCNNTFEVWLYESGKCRIVAICKTLQEARAVCYEYGFIMM